jgi:hypothetical protein
MLLLLVGASAQACNKMQEIPKTFPLQSIGNAWQLIMKQEKERP